MGRVNFYLTRRSSVNHKPKHNTFCFVDTFSSLDDLRAKDRSNDDMVAAMLVKVKRFSIFEATEHQNLAATLMRLKDSGRVKTDNSCGYPWIEVVEVDGELVR